MHAFNDDCIFKRHLGRRLVLVNVCWNEKQQPAEVHLSERFETRECTEYFTEV
jgi:hypothetical protein